MKTAQLIISSKREEPKNVFDYLNVAVKKQLPHTQPIEALYPETLNLAFMGDLHYGHYKTDHDRIIEEIVAIKKSPNTILALMGDLVNGIHWGGESQDEQCVSLTEQYGFLSKLFEELKGKIIVGLTGEHDSKWASRCGANPYLAFTEKTGAPYVDGIAEVALTVGEVTYPLILQHKARGNSMYNADHPVTRQSVFHLQGGSVYAAAHTHRKKISQDAMRGFGVSKRLTKVMCGPYNWQNIFGAREGFVSLTPDEMYGSIVRFHPDRDLIDMNYDILEGIKQWE